MPSEFDLRGLNCTQIPNTSLDIVGGTSHFSGGLCLRWSLETKTLTAISCQGNFDTQEIEIPEGIEFWGVDAGPLVNSTEAIYHQARIATLMGRKIIINLAPEVLENEMGERHLANMGADAWRAIRDLIPESISGALYLESHGPLEEDDAVIDPDTRYRVRLATEHPIYENERAQKFVRFMELLNSKSLHPDARYFFMGAAGELMIQSHFSYDHRCNLGNKESDLLVRLAREMGKYEGIFGAKLSGNGDSTRVAILCDRKQNTEVDLSIDTIVAKYKRQMGKKPEILE